MREAIARQYCEDLWLSHKREAAHALAQTIAYYGLGPMDSGLLHKHSSLLDSIYPPNRSKDEDFERLVEICQAGRVGLQRIAEIPACRHIGDTELQGDFGDWLATLRLIALLSEKCLDGPWNDWGLDLAHDFQSAGEWAVFELARYGFVSPKHGGGDWTEVGRALLESAET